jgi:tetratricopeptide (TPR) repeat protein
MTTETDREGLIKKFFELEDADECVVSAWVLFIDVQRAYKDEKAGTISRRERDKLRRKFDGYVRKNKLRMLGEEEGLKAHELAIVKGEEGEGEIKTLNSFDVWLLTDFEEVCSVLVADEPKEVEGFPGAITKFLEDPDVDEWLKERLIEKNKEAGERLLKAILEDRPADVNVHSLLAEHYEREGRFSEAEAEYTRMLSETDDELVWANYGYFLERRQGRYEDAFEALKNSLEICERVGEGEAGEFLEEVKRSISRVERMKDLEGEKARAAREYQEAMWLIADIMEFAEKRMEREIKKAQEEYMKEKEMEEIVLEDTFDFMYWFLFHRKQSNGKVPGMVYAEEESLGEVTKERLKGLESPVEGTFEIVDVDHASFKLAVKDIITDEEYALMGDFSGISEGQIFSGNIYPWSDFYLTGGAVATYIDDHSERLKKFAEELKSGKLLEDAKKELKKEHDAFVLYFGTEDTIFKSKKECEKAFNKFSKWFLFEYVSVTEKGGKTAAEIYEEKYGEKPKPERTKLPRSFAGAGDIGAISYPEYGISFVRHYGFLKRVFETGADDEIEEGKEKLKEILLNEEPFILKKLMKGKERNTVKIINSVFDAGLGMDASEEEIGAFMGELREDWNVEPEK